MEEYAAARGRRAGRGRHRRLQRGARHRRPDPGSPEYQAADAQARQIAAEQAAEASNGQGLAPQTEPPPGGPEYRAAEAEARELGEGAWENLGVFGQLDVAFERFNEENKKRGAALGADSNCPASGEDPRTSATPGQW